MPTFSSLLSPLSCDININNNNNDRTRTGRDKSVGRLAVAVQVWGPEQYTCTVARTGFSPATSPTSPPPPRPRPVNYISTKYFQNILNPISQYEVTVVLLCLSVGHMIGLLCVAASALLVTQQAGHKSVSARTLHSLPPLAPVRPM